MAVTSEKSLFLTEDELALIRKGVSSSNSRIIRFYEALKKRVRVRLSRNLDELGETTDWYYPAMEYISDAAMFWRISEDEEVGRWLRTITLDLAKRPVSEWVGPDFRDHSQPFTGHLETAHLCWASAIALDLASGLFSAEEQQSLRQAIREKGITLCERWVTRNHHLANWRGILVSGIIVGAAVLRDEALLENYIPEWNLCVQAFQSDGSYAESLQYGNYLAFALMLAYEVLVREYPDSAARLDMGAYARGIRWIACSMFYPKPLSNWHTDEPVARAANFNDSAAIFRSSGDLLLHIAVRHRQPEEAGLAGWLFNRYYEPVPDLPPHELASFGMCNDWGFLTLPFLTWDIPRCSPQEAGLPVQAAFSNGHSFLRDKWDGQTIVAINGGGDPLRGPGHLHGDLNSFILTYQQERLLVDPGHSCYRNLIHGLESSSQTHNTCTFLRNSDPLGLQEDKAKAALLEQNSMLPRRLIVNGNAGLPIDRGNRRLMLYSDDHLSVVGAECGAAYGDPIQSFRRYWFLVHAQILVVFDEITASEPVTTVWNWVVNNRDGKTFTRKSGNQLTVCRGKSGLRMIHKGNATLGHPVYSFMHDAYHIRPGQMGEGRSGSALVYRYTDKDSALNARALHVFLMDHPDRLDTWRISESEEYISIDGKDVSWSFHLTERLTLRSGSGRSWEIFENRILST